MTVLVDQFRRRHAVLERVPFVAYTSISNSPQTAVAVKVVAVAVPLAAFAGRWDRIRPGTFVVTVPITIVSILITALISEKKGQRIKKLKMLLY